VKCTRGYGVVVSKDGVEMVSGRSYGVYSGVAGRGVALVWGLGSFAWM